MIGRDVKTAVAGVKLLIFTVVSLVVTGMLAMIMGHFDYGRQTEYTALFSNASELTKGDDVRVAGVSVGAVTGVDLVDGRTARVSFKIDSDVPVTTASGAQVRYVNLVGDRYLNLTQGRSGAAPLPAGGTIPVEQTTPALNLTALFNGFQPLFEALTPTDVNKLSLNLIKVLQGEGGTISSVLAQTASLTSTLADRNQLISQVIGNLSATLQTVDSHHRQLSQLLSQMNSWMGDLARDRTTIGDSVQNVADLSRQLAGLLVDIRPATKADIAQLRSVARILNRPANRKIMADTLRRLPTELRRQTRIGTHGSWYDYYLCDLDARILLPSLGPALDGSPVIKALQKELSSLAFYSTAKRCDV